MERKFIRMKVVEDDIINEQEFLKEFSSRCDAEAFPIVIKIDEAPDLTLLMLDGQLMHDFIRTHRCAEHISVETDNLVQQLPGVQIKKWFHPLPFFHFKNANTKTKHLAKKFMMFVGSHRWPRFILSEHMHKYHRNQTFLTYWQKHFQTKNLQQHLPGDRIEEFKAHLPMYVESTETIQKHQNGYIDYEDTNALEEFYHQSFLDLVCETWHMGDTFLPTEKIARPLSLKNPFMVYGPRYFLKNLKRLGFKTFGDYWSEDYDRYEGIERINMIKTQIDLISKQSLDELQVMLGDMDHVLEHNHKLYQKITLDAINTEFCCG